MARASRGDGAAALARAGFDVISMAGNHCMDWGNEAFFETRANLAAAGISVATLQAWSPPPDADDDRARARELAVERVSRRSGGVGRRNLADG